MKLLSLSFLASLALAPAVEEAPEPEPTPAPAEAEAEAEAASPWAEEATVVSAELRRGIEELRLDGAPAPYRASVRYVRARVLSLDASFGGLITDVVEHQAAGVGELRVGSEERDNANYFGGEGGLARVGVPIDPAPEYLRRKVWLALDNAFRGATQAYAQKTAALEQLESDDFPADYAKRGGPAPRVRVDPTWEEQPLPRAELGKLAKSMSAQFEKWPTIDNGDVYIQVMQSHETVVDSEGMSAARVRQRMVIAVVADTKASDGMHLDHALAIHFAEVPKVDDALQGQAMALVDQVLRELDELARAPMIEEEYDGPVLFRGEAAAQLLASTVATEVAGSPAPLADGGRLMDLEPTWQRRLGKNVMPPWIDLVDDPTAEGFGHYELDAEGVRPGRLPLVEDGVLEHLLMTRTPNQKVSGSNGRARMSPSLEVGPALSNLTLDASQKRMSDSALERELFRRAREDGYEVAYVVEQLRDGSLLGPVPRESATAYAGTGKVSVPTPARVYRLEPGGKKTLLRGVVLAPVSMRALRRIRAVGREATVVPLRIAVGPFGGFSADIGIDSVLSQTVDVQITTPDLLVDGLELLVERGEHGRMPTLVHPLRRGE